MTHVQSCEEAKSETFQSAVQAKDTINVSVHCICAQQIAFCDLPIENDRQNACHVLA